MTLDPFLQFFLWKAEIRQIKLNIPLLFEHPGAETSYK